MMGEIELLAKMWMVCDPNRQPCAPDELDHSAHGELKGKPRWHWFIPRAEASLKYLDEHGFHLDRKHKEAGK